MELRRLVTDDDAVSPVIGVILMVAITVILAAVIGAFVLGFGGGGPSAPSVTWESSNTSLSGNQVIAFEHGGGDTVDDPTTLEISGQSTDYYNGTFNDLADADSVTTGDAITTNTTSQSEYTLVWNSPDGDSSQELSSYNN